MRLLRSTVVVAMSAACAGMLLLLPAQAQAAPGGGGTHNLSVTPSHGQPNSVVTAVYNRSGAFCFVAHITFRWDGKQIDDQLDHNCTATSRFHPPNNDRAPGVHQILVTDSVTHTDVTAQYTIDGNGMGQGGMTQGGMTTPTPGSTANDPPTQQPSAASSGILPPSSLVDAAAGGKNTTTGTKQGWTSWALIAGAVLVLGGVGILGTVMLRMRRERAAGGGYPPSLY